MTSPDPPFSPRKLKSARHVSDMLGMWPLCAEATCRRLGQCRAPHPTCFQECIELVPSGAGAYVFALFEGKKDGLSYDDALARVPEDLHEEWDSWHAAIERITGRPSLKPRKGE